MESITKKTFLTWVRERELNLLATIAFNYYLAGIGRVLNEEVTEEDFDVYWNNFKFRGKEYDSTYESLS
jgi:hypothetical protein